MGKLLTIAQAAKERESLKAQGKKVVFTNGVFDLLHAGHLSILEKARALGDVLIVGLNSDASVKAIKGEGRPIMDEHVRAEMLCALKFVDFVVIFAERTPEKLLAQIKPDIHVKGGDWKGKVMPEKKLVESYGGRVEIVESNQSVSTTELIKKMRGK